MNPNNAEEETVFFLRDISLEQEMAFVKNPITKKKEAIPQGVKGNNLLPKRAELLEKTGFNFEKAKISSSLSQDFDTTLVLGLLSIEPFYNLIKIFCERVGRTDFKTINSINEIIIKKKLGDLDFSEVKLKYSSLIFKDSKSETSKDLYHFEVFKGLLKLLHDEFTKQYFFDEEDWQNPADMKYKRVRGHFTEFSPIRDIFCGEMKYDSEPRSINDFYNLKLVKEGTNVQEQIDYNTSMAYRSSYNKTPIILTVFGNKNCKPECDVKMVNDWYTLRCLITTSEGGYNLYLRDEKIICYSNGLISEISSINEVKGEILVILYRKNRIKIK